MTSSSSSYPSPPFSSTPPRWTYDVFLSFRGEDTRRSFTSHLYTALRRSEIHTFMADEIIERGANISGSLERAIERSRMSIIVFSRNFASSRWCLDEVVKIMECQRSQGHVVIPIFDRVDPSDVRHQKGKYGESMKQHEQNLGKRNDQILRWREALTAAANIAGFSTSAYRSESQLIEIICEDISKKLDVGQLFVADHPVGIESRVHDLTIEWSKKIPPKALIIGLCGMGGIGKTTVAKAIYNNIGIRFRARSFLANIRENSKHSIDQVNLQKQLITDITKTQVFKIPNIDSGKRIIQERFPKIKAFVVLDDVDTVNQLNALCESNEWFCAGSVILITTRDKHMLDVLKADHKYIVREMNETESLELFSWHAFKQATPLEEFIELSKDVVAYCGGLPLALEILGSSLRERTVEEWKATLSKLESIPNKDIQSKLRISYDGLNDYMEKEIFLDICCFFINKDRNYVTQILDGCRLHAENHGLPILIERNLVKVGTNNKLEMHDLLQEMGKEIVRESSPKDPEKRSRLWLREDVLDVLTEHTGTKAIEGISLNVPKTQTQREECLIDSKAFKKMRKLRLLRLDYVNLEGNFEHFSRSLRWLCWHGFPLNNIPNNFYQKKLVAIDFKYSNLKVVWKEPQLLDMLKTLNLSHSHYLTQTPDFTYLPSLEMLVVKDCLNLIFIHESIGDLENLIHVNLKGCSSLRDLPRSMYKLTSLKTLILSGCSMIDHLEEDIEQMESLTTLMANNTAITQVPFSLARVEGLVQHGYVSLCGYEGRAQDIFPSLISSWMSRNNIPISRIDEFVQSISSINITFVRNNGFRGLSPFMDDLVKFRGIWEECRSRFRFNQQMARLLDALYETSFMELESALDSPQISYMEASSSFESHKADSFSSLLIQLGVCNKADSLKEKISLGWKNGGRDDSHLPGHQYPDWFMYKCDGRSLIFKVPEATGCSLKAMLLSVVYCPCMDNVGTQFLIDILIINYTNDTVHHHKRHCVTSKEVEEWESIISSFEPGDVVELVLSIGPQFHVKKIAAYLIYNSSKHSKSMKSLAKKLIRFVR